MELRINDQPRQADVAPETSLLEVLRDHLGLTGAKYGCGEARCGACVVLLDGVPVPACVTPVREAVGKPVVTVEGIGNGEKLHPVQQAFIDENALQCGYCTPGMIVSAVALLQRDPEPTEEEIRTFMEPHLCRCGVHLRIIRAIQRAGATMKGAGK
ncbi:MAG TPA: (2Fe-2S)-binding protein [Chloroflexota bacterium]|nr:(2Fe-2S)-binding protein [Chloroflexota bacterium]